MGRKITLIGALISLFTGCAKRPPEPPPPAAPGTSSPLSYPVLLVADRKLAVKEDEESLTTTTVSSGLNFPEFKLIDSGGIEYSIRKVTDFGRRSAFLDMGTTPFHVFLQLEKRGTISLSDAQALVLSAALAPHGVVSDSPEGAKVATRRVQGARSLAQLIDECRKSWEWR